MSMVPFLMACFNILLKTASEESPLILSFMIEFQILGHDSLCKIDPNLFLRMAHIDLWIAV